jgi:putative aminopeptidase FrvX
MNALMRALVVVMALHWPAFAAPPQQSLPAKDWQRVLSMPAVSGHEQPLAAEIRKRLRGLSPTTDDLGNLYYTIGSGAPHRLVVTPIDEPGYEISEIRDDGFLRVRRLPRHAPKDVFDALNFAQPVVIATRRGTQVMGVFAGLSAPVKPDRENHSKMAGLDELYVDIGAKSAEAVRGAGVELSDPLAIARQWPTVGKSGEAGPATGDRFGAFALARVLEEAAKSEAKGTTTIAFLTQSWIGGGGLNQILTEMHPDELIYVGRASSEPAVANGAAANQPRPGSGIVIGSSAARFGAEQSLAAEFQTIAEKEHIPVHLVASKAEQISGGVNGASIPARWVKLSVPTLWPVTPGEYLDWKDLAQLRRLLEAYLNIPEPPGESSQDLIVTRKGRASEALIGSYGASGHEDVVRDLLQDQLDYQLRDMAKTDSAGNLVLHLGDGKIAEGTPRIAFVAHMDEIGYAVNKIEDDGRLQVKMLGRGYPQYFLGHVVLVHKKDGTRVAGVLELPTGWDKKGFEWPSGPSATDHVYVGTHTKEESEKLGIAAGDYVTMPKKYHQLLGTRANAPSADDRVGCDALIVAANAIGPQLPGRDVTFVWSTEGGVGSKGAAEFAKQAAKDGRAPDFVFAVDAFISSDSRLESRPRAGAELGKGFVVPAADSSPSAALQSVDRIVALANKHQIPVQHGVTAGENDGSVFSHYGSVSVALGFPLRYSHSPADLIDTRDFDALGSIVEVLAHEW